MGEPCLDRLVSRSQGKSDLSVSQQSVLLPRQLVKVQQDRGNKIMTLSQTMKALYLVVASSQNLQDGHLHDVLEHILKQMIVCCFFI